VLFKFKKFSKLLHKSYKITNLLRSNLFIVLIFVLLTTNIAIKINADMKDVYGGEDVIIKKAGLFCGDLLDLLVYANEKSLIREFNYGKKVTVSNREEARSQPPNIVCIQVESLDPNVIHLKYKEKYIAPFLHKLSSECIYYPYMLNYCLACRSADTEFTIFNSIIPLRNSPSIKLRTYGYPNSIIKQLNKHGFKTKAFHGNEGSFYNRSVAYDKMGFQEFFDMGRMKETKHWGWGMRDEDTFSFVKKQIQNQKAPFFYYIITMSSHEPRNVKEYYLEERYSDIENSPTRNYFNAISYVDKELEDFALFIKDKVKNCYIFIYSDHGQGIILEGDSSLFQWSDNCVLFISTPDNASYVEKKSVASLLDMGVTILKASGIDFEIYSHGADLVEYPVKEKGILTKKGNLEKRTSLFDNFEKEFKNLRLMEDNINK